MATLTDIANYCNRFLQVDGVHDYCPNGIQVEGPETLDRIVTGVTASQALIDRAVELEADAILVHHGYFWRGESQPLTGMKFKRIKTLIDNRIGLLGFHLPLDLHPTHGNNALLGQALGLHNDGTIAAGGTDGLFWYGHFPEPMSVASTTRNITEALGRAPVVVGSETKEIKTVGWCTGGAQQFIELAAELRLDAYISGEISEQTTHIARENGVAYFAAGHHATERFGVKALGEHLANNFELANDFVDIDNPA